MGAPNSVLMNFFLRILKARLFMLALACVVTSLYSVRMFAQCEAPTLKFYSPVLISGTNGQAGAVYLFQNVNPGVDAHIEVLGLYGGATLYNIDDSAGIGYYDAFQPYVGAAPNDTSYIDWKITFKVAGTTTDTLLPCIAVTGVDVDGDGAYLKEFIEAATPGSIAVDPATILNVSFDGVRSKAISTIYNIPLIDTSRLEAMFQMNFTNISTLLYRNGAVSTYGAQQIRQTCIYFKPFFHSSTFTLLPAKILSFGARTENEFTKIEWSASQEKDLEQYVVEKSVDRNTWSAVRIINPGNHAVNYYSVSDPEKNPGEVYYRLKQQNHRGSFSYSKIVSVRYANDQGEDIIHNTVVRNTLNLQVTSTANEDYLLEYYNMSGAKLQHQRFTIFAGRNFAAVGFPAKLSPGSYIVVIRNKAGERIYTSRVIKN